MIFMFMNFVVLIARMFFLISIVFMIFLFFIVFWFFPSCSCYFKSYLCYYSTCFSLCS
jgi:hypothetical protein